MILGFITRNFENETPEVITRLYMPVVKPHLPYDDVQLCSPCFLKDETKSETIQKRAIKLTLNLSREEKLRICFLSRVVESVEI